MSEKEKEVREEIREREAEAQFIKAREEIQKVLLVKIESYLKLFHSFLELSLQGIDIYDDIKKTWRDLSLLVDTYLSALSVAHYELERRK
jgi:hypothetical protein